MFILRIIPILFILLSLLCPISLHAQTAKEYYKQGLELKKQNKINEAIEAFQKAVEKDNKFAEAYYELALAYQLKKTPAALNLAEEAMLEAKKYGSDDVKYLSALALIYEDRYFYPVAKSTWERVLEIDPDNIDAIAGMARIHANEAKNYRNKVSYNAEEILRTLKYEPELAILFADSFSNYYIFYPWLWDKNMLEYLDKATGVLFMPAEIGNLLEHTAINELKLDEFAAYENSIAKAYNKNILEIDPDNRDALYRLGLVYFDSDSLKEFAQLFEELIEKHPDDKDGHLFLGLAYHRLHDYDKANKQYEIAKSLMSDEERAVFANIGYLKVGGLEEPEINTCESDTLTFWVQRDPLYLTAYNERQLEHYSRVAEANLRFSVPSEGIEGWQSERGKIFIKYGNPDKKKNYNNNDAGFDGNINLIKEYRDAYFDRYGRYLNTDYNIDYYKHDYWYYQEFTFMFETGYGDEEDKYKLGTSMSGLNFIEIAAEIEKEYPEYYKYEPKGSFIDFPFDIATFRGEEDRTRLEVYYGVPFNKVRFEEEGEYYYGSYQTGVFLHDSDWNRIIDNIQDKSMEFNVTEIDTSSDDLAVDVDRFEYQVNPGWFHFAIEIKDWYSDNVGTYRDTLKLEEYGYDTLQISDVQLASHIALLDSTGAVTRNNLNIIPNPPRFYRANQPIYIYYEIYNLFLSDFPGNTDYTVEYNMDYIGEEKYSITDFVRRLIVNEKQVLGVSTIFTRSGREKDESSFLRIDHTLTKAGPYQLTLKVTDNIAKKSAEKSVVLRLFENR